MKILIGQNHLNTLGGSETYTYTLVEEMIRRGYHVDMICNRKGIVSEIMEERFKIKVNSLRKEYDYCFISHNSIVEKALQSGIECEKIFQICQGLLTFWWKKFIEIQNSMNRISEIPLNKGLQL